jgi:hypothetical protein
MMHPLYGRSMKTIVHMCIQWMHLGTQRNRGAMEEKIQVVWAMAHHPKVAQPLLASSKQQ